MQGHSYRLRLINALTIECPVVVTIDRHEMTAIATDGRPVKPVTARSVQLYPGNIIYQLISFRLRFRTEFTELKCS